VIYLLTAIGLPPGDSSTAHIYTQTTQNDTKLKIHRTTQKIWKTAGRAAFWRVIPWHLPYNWGKSKEKPQFPRNVCSCLLHQIMSYPTSLQPHFPRP